MPRIELQAAECRYRGDRGQTVVGIRDLNLTLDPGELLAVLGISGSGKTTVLRVIAGLETLSAGQILIDGQRVNEVSAAERDMGMMFQRPALLPHLTVQENLALGLKLRRIPPALIRDSIRSIADRLGLGTLLERFPGQLSGGEQQRTALGRALIRRPQVLLLDEPLSHLDAPFKRRLRSDIVSLHRENGLTTILVTHDLADVAKLGCRLAILDSGRLVQTGTLEELRRSPFSSIVSELLKDD